MRKSQSRLIDLEIFRKRATWAEVIVTKFPEFQDYAGSGRYAEDLSNVHIGLKIFGNNPQLRCMLKIRLMYLRQKARANFAGLIANEITTLAFLKGIGKTKGIRLTKLEQETFKECAEQSK